MYVDEWRGDGTTMTGSKRVLLVVEDDEDVRQAVSEALAAEGYDVTEAPDGAAALERARSSPPDLILLDMRMPGMDGWHFVQEYGRVPGVRAPIVVMTTGRDAASWASDIGADAYLAKPFDLEVLLKTVREHTG